jgi:hypothetical protein
VTRQSLRQHAAFVLLDGLRDRINIGGITDQLIGIGYIENNPDDYRRWQVEQARRTVREHRKSKARTGDIQRELVHLYEVKEDGSKTHYFHACGELTPQEAAQHLQYWEGKIAEDQEQYARYRAFHLKRHGKKLQRLLSYGPDGKAAG